MFDGQFGELIKFSLVFSVIMITILATLLLILKRNFRKTYTENHTCEQQTLLGYNRILFNNKECKWEMLTRESLERTTILYCPFCGKYLTVGNKL